MKFVTVNMEVIELKVWIGKSGHSYITDEVGLLSKTSMFSATLSFQTGLTLMGCFRARAVAISSTLVDSSSMITP